MMFGQHAALIDGEEPRCPQCDGVELRRHGRTGFWQRVVMPRFGLFPWECGLCRKIFFLPQRSTDYQHHVEEESVTALKFELVRAPGIAPAAPIAPKAASIGEPVRRKQHVG